MSKNKTIHREEKSSTKIFDDRSLAVDYATLIPILREGLSVLDVGCGTGSISKDIANAVGRSGHVVGIDNTKHFIESGKESCKGISNLELIHSDLFSYEPNEKFDLVVSARTFQWLSNPAEALQKIKTWIKPGGMVSILDYNHEAIEWYPKPPKSMLLFYDAFLKWRANAGMNNHIAENLEEYFTTSGFRRIEVLEANEVSTRSSHNFTQRAGIWSKVAELNQIVAEGYLDEATRLQAIKEYDLWVDTSAERMILKLTEVRGRIQ
jgi:ubiquinone/menaquinone biosynthesis C-methylase UbiE